MQIPSGGSGGCLCKDLREEAVWNGLRRIRGIASECCEQIFGVAKKIEYAVNYCGFEIRCWNPCGNRGLLSLSYDRLRSVVAVSATVLRGVGWCVHHPFGIEEDPSEKAGLGCAGLAPITLTALVEEAPALCPRFGGR